MARAKLKADDGGEVKTQDFDLAKRIYIGDIKPARSKASEYMQEVSTGFKAVKKQAHIQPSAMKAAIKVVEMEDAKRDDWLRGFNGVLSSHNIDSVPTDMVDAMERPKPQLVAVKPPAQSDGTETDLAGDDFTEATEEELAKQEGRSKPD